MSHAATLSHSQEAVKEAIDALIASLVGKSRTFLRRLNGIPEQQLLDAAQKYARALRLEHATADDIRRLRLLLEGLDIAQVRARNQHAMKKARERGKRIKHELVAKGSLVPAETLADTLGVSRQAIHKGLKGRRFFAVDAGGRELYYPAFFAEKDLRAAGLDEALSILAEENAWSKWLFFTTPLGSLGGLTPIEALRKKKREEVLTAARGYIE